MHFLGREKREWKECCQECDKKKKINDCFRVANHRCITRFEHWRWGQQV